MEKEWQILEEGPKVEIHLNSLKATLKKYQTGKLYDLMANTDSGLKNSHPSMRLATEINRCVQEAYKPEWMTTGKTTLIQKDPIKGTTPNNYDP